MHLEFIKFVNQTLSHSLFTGIWGSAFTILLQRVLHDGESHENAIKSVHNSGDLREEIRMYLFFRSVAILTFRA